MPHQCTNCGRTFADGSKEMLSGCPDCGGNKFQFAPTAAATADSSAEAEGSGSLDSDSATAESTAPESDSVATRAADTVRDLVSGDSPEPSEGDSPTGSPLDGSAGATQSDGSWPSSEDAPGTESKAPPDGEFEEWPDTARRPEDRSESPDGTRPGPANETRATGETESEWPPQSSPSSGPTTTIADDENSAQAEARSEVIPTDDLPSDSETSPRDASEHGIEGDAERAAEPDAERGTTADKTVETTSGVEAGADGGRTGDGSPDHGRVVSEPSGQRPSLEELRAELNEQFESIKIVSPGQYELNLMELYNREEYIISLQEDGRYVIDVPDSWRAGENEDE
jgi:predicted  nucleic acid-binding Zn-ribbon protein